MSSSRSAQRTRGNRKDAIELVQYSTHNDIPYQQLLDDQDEEEDTIQKRGTFIQFFDNRHVILRCILIFLSLFLAACCMLYAIGQIMTLQLTNYFCSPVSLNSIRHHSKQLNLTYGDYDNCWISKGIKVNNDKLFSLNAYDGKIEVTGPRDILRLIIFSLIGCWFTFCCIYFTVLLIRDLRNYLNGYYHRKRNNAFQIESDKQQTGCISDIKNFVKSIWGCYKLYCGPDKALWAFVTFGLEAFEIILQSIVCLNYAGVQLGNTSYNDKHNISLVWQEVLLYVMIIALNSICTGILWLLYVFKHDIFKGDLYHYIIFLVDAIFDTCYVLFPLAVVIYDGNDIAYAAGALQIVSFSKFLSAFWPLGLLSVKVFTASNTMIKKSKEYWYGEFSSNFMTMDGMTADESHHTEKEENFKEMYNPYSFLNIFTSGKQLIDSRNIDRAPSLLAQSTVINPIDAHMYLDYKRQQLFRRSCLVCMGVLWLLFGIIIIILSLTHFYNAFDECDNPNHEILQNHLELLTWPYCSYKVYPFTGFDEINSIPCQCRTLFIQEDDYDEIGMNESIVTHVFENFYSLQNVKMVSPLMQDTKFEFTKDMFRQTSIRSVSMNGFDIKSIDNDGIVNWQSIEYLEFNMSHVGSLPNNISKLNNMRYLNLAWNQVFNIDFICNFKNLRYLSISGNPISSTPSCIYEDLLEIQNLHFAAVTDFFDYRMLALPQLLSLKAIAAHISIQDFPSNESFIYNLDTFVELQANNICDDLEKKPLDIRNYSNTLWTFLNETNACAEYCSYVQDAYLYAHCQYSDWKNGVCDVGCNNEYCYYDGGDCNQLCDTNICNQTLWMNDKCDQQCDKYQCSYDWGSCLAINDSRNYEQCTQQTSCKLDWVDKMDQTSWCDEDCNNHYCQYDNGDCDGCNADSDCYSYWFYFTFISNSEYLIDKESLCFLWSSYVGPYGDDVDYNCTSIIDAFDVDGDHKLNAYEAIRVLFGSDERVMQINCSLCCDYVEQYYTPWTFDTIQYWVNVTKYHDKQDNLIQNATDYSTGI